MFNLYLDSKSPVRNYLTASTQACSVRCPPASSGYPDPSALALLKELLSLILPASVTESPWKSRMLSLLKKFFFFADGNRDADNISGIITAINPPGAAFFMKLRMLLLFYIICYV